jgi:hypothetical protein
MNTLYIEKPQITLLDEKLVTTYKNENIAINNTPSIPNYLSVLIGTQILKDL